MMKIKDLYDILLPLASDVSALKSDMKEHMRRTAIAESEIAVLKRGQWMFLGALSLFTLAGTAIALLKLLN